MARKSPRIETGTSESKRADDFKSVAKRLECDEDKGRFEQGLGKIAKAKPQPKK